MDSKYNQELISSTYDTLDVKSKDLFEIKAFEQLMWINSSTSLHSLQVSVVWHCEFLGGVWSTVLVKPGVLVRAAICLPWLILFKKVHWRLRSEGCSMWSWNALTYTCCVPHEAFSSAFLRLNSLWLITKNGAQPTDTVSLFSTSCHSPSLSSSSSTRYIKLKTWLISLWGLWGSSGYLLELQSLVSRTPCCKPKCL